MIYEAIKGAVASVTALRGVYPTGVCIDEEEFPIAVYTFGKQTAETDLSGEVHHYTDEVFIDLLSESYVQLHDLYRQVERALLALANGADGAGEYIFGVSCGSPEADAADLPIGLMRRTLQCSIQWCELTE